jgi:hypothetical protein
MVARGRTIDPSQINDSSQIPPRSAHPVGLSVQGLVDVYSGTLLGDADAPASAKELLGPAPDTGGLANADYIYNQVSALYGRAELPTFQSPSGRDVKAVVFVSGSSQGSYGAFHFNVPGNQAEFDRIVVDSLDASGTYSPGSGLGAAMAAQGEAPEGRTGLLKPYHGSADLLAVTQTRDPRLEGAKSAEIKLALDVAAHSLRALTSAVETRNTSAFPAALRSHLTKEEPVQQLTRINRDLQGLVRAAVGGTGGRQYLSTAFFAAELVESFQALTRNADPGKTDGEAVSRVVAYKLAPEISLIPGFNSAVVQQWWHDGHTDFVNDNSQDDGSADGNGAGVIFLEFLNDYLGVPLDRIIQQMPKQGGAPLGATYVSLQDGDSSLADVAGKTGASAFRKMISLLQEIQNPDGTLNLPANGNPFPAMRGAKQGGLFAAAGAGRGVVSTGPLAQDTQGSLQLLTQLEQQAATLRSALQQVQQDVSAGPSPIGGEPRADSVGAIADTKEAYGPPLGASVVAKVEQQVATYRAPQYDQPLRDEFWPHVYNELPGTGPRTNRLQVISGTIQSPEAVQVTGTIRSTKPEKDGDLHIEFQPDDPKFPTNHDSAEPPLEIEIIYAGPVSQPDALQAERGYTNPFDITPLKSGTRIQVAGPLIFDTAHGRVDPSGVVQYGLEIHPAAAVTVLSVPTPPPAPAPGDGSALTADLASALSQAGALAQTLGDLTALLQKMRAEAPAR